MPITSAATTPMASAPDAVPGIGATALSLILVLVLILALGALLKRVQGRQPGRPGELRVRAGLQVGAKERVLLIEAAGTHLLIGVSGGGIHTLHRFDSLALPPESSAGAAPNSSLKDAFVEVLRRSSGYRGNP